MRCPSASSGLRLIRASYCVAETAFAIAYAARCRLKYAARDADANDKHQVRKRCENESVLEYESARASNSPHAYDMGKLLVFMGRHHKSGWWFESVEAA